MVPAVLSADQEAPSATLLFDVSTASAGLAAIAIIQASDGN